MDNKSETGCVECDKLARKAQRRGWVGIHLCLTHQIKAAEEREAENRAANAHDEDLEDK